MNKVTNIILVMLSIVSITSACKDIDKTLRDVQVTAVKKLYEPVGGKAIYLTNSESETIHFEWEPVKLDNGEVVSYELVFDREDGSFSEPIYRLSSANDGLAHFVAVGQQAMDEIVQMAGAGVGGRTNLKWAVISSVAGSQALSLQTKALQVIRRTQETIDGKGLKVVVLGSSTAEGSGATSGQGWVDLYTAYLKNINENYEVINLAKGGYTTYHIMPNGHTVAGRPGPDTDRNMTKALLYSPDVIIVNMPSNDVNNGYTYKEIMDNYDKLRSLAEDAGVQIYFTSTQPRNFSEQQRKEQKAIRDATKGNYPTRYIEFWTGIAEDDGTIKAKYNSGDGIHLNNAGHSVLFERMVAVANILSHAKVIGTEVYSPTGRILIDIGGTSSLTMAPDWNNVTGPRQVGTAYAVPLKNTNQERTPFRIYVHDAFNEVNYEGVPAGVTLGDYPNSAVTDSFYGNNTAFNGATEPTGGLTLDRLDKQKLYSFTIFAGRRGVGSSDIREAKYTVIGKTTKTATLNSSNNVSDKVFIEDIEPDANGRIIIEVTYGSGNNHSNKFYYLGTLDITYKPN